MKKNLKKVLLFSLLLAFLNDSNKNLALASFANPDQKQEKVTPDSLLLQQFNRAFHFLRNGEFQSSEQSFWNAIHTIEQGGVSNKNMVYRTYVNFGILLNRLGKRNEAIIYYDLAENFTIANFGEESEKLVPIYTNKGNIFNDLDNLFKAKSYYEKALTLIDNKNSRYLSHIHNNLGNIYYKREEYDLALNSFKKSLLIKQKSKKGNQSTSLNGIANCYKKLGNFNEAKKYFIKSIDYLKKIGGEDHYILGDLYLNYAVFQDEMGDRKSVLIYLQLARDVYLKNYGTKHPDMANCLRNFGNFYSGQKENESALEYYQKAIVSEIDNFNDSNIYTNPNLNEIDPQFSILKILKAKSKALTDLYKSNTGLISDLDFGLQTYDLCLDIIDKIRIAYQNEESKFALSQNENDTYKAAIKTAVKLHRLTGDTEYKNKAFRYTERSKAASLLSSLNDINAKNFGGIPAGLQEQELQLRKNIATYRENVYEERKKVKPNRDKITEWQEELFALNKKYDAMVLRFEEDYPEYYALKYNNKTIGVEDLQSKLEAKDVFIEYAISDSSLFTFTITPNSFHIGSRELNIDTFNHHLEEVRNSLKTNCFAENSVEFYKRYTKSAHYLYKILIQPHDSLLKDKRLVIVPDGKMAYIPFGVLLREEADSIRMNYRDLSYLIKSNTIAYQNSATIGFSIEPADFSFLSNKSVLAFAPSYKGVSDSILYAKRKHQNKLYPLPYARKEIYNISNVIAGDLYLDEKATEQNFKDHAADYDVLHLAMHTIIDDENPMYSKLVFTQTPDTLQDGLLNTYEIYNMNFNARMVVLSACSTGDGKLLKGEGVMSLARGFFYAGCPGIVMTLWTVEDKTGSDLMTSFYGYLAQGLQKDDALRQAKLEYLKTADPLKSHPYFWSGYVAMGNVEPLYSFDLKAKLIYMAIGSIGLILLVIFRRRIRTRKLKQ